jgi:hypothetical protein
VLTEARLSVPVPYALAAAVREIAERDCVSLSATLRRLIARGVATEYIRQASAGESHRESQGVR